MGFLGDYCGTTFRNNGFYAVWVDCRNDGGDAYAAWFNFVLCIPVSLPNTDVIRDQTFRMPVTTGTVSGQNVTAFSATITFDPAFRETVPPYFDTTGTMSGGWTVTESHTANTLTINGSGAFPLSGSGSLIKTVLHVLPTAPIGQTSPVQLSAFQYNDGTPCTSRQPGSVSVINNFADLAGNIRYHGSNLPVDSIVVDLEPGAESLSNIAGRYEFLDLLRNVIYVVTPLRVSGPTCAGCITFFDASLTARGAIGQIALDSLTRCAADVSGNGAVFFFDASLIAQYAIGLINEFPCACRWCFNPLNRGYTPLWGDSTSEHYAAMLMGDVSGNWSAAAGIPPSSLLHSRELRLDLSGFAAVNVSHDDAFSVQFDCRFDEQDLTFSGVALREAAEDWQWLVRREPGVIHVGAYGISPVGSGREILRVDFNTLSGAVGEVPLRVEGFRINDSPPVSLATVLAVQPIQPTCEIASVYPNPFNPVTTITYSVPARATVQLLVFDVTGRQAAVLADGLHEAGTYRVPFDAGDLGCGIYFVRLRSGEFETLRKIALLK